MTSNTEIGHARNVGQFEDLYYAVKEYGDPYKPAKDPLTPEELYIVWQSAVESLQAVNDAQNQYSLAVDRRQKAFSELQPFVTRVINALSVSAAPASTVEDARSIQNKLVGRRATPMPVPEEEGTTPKTNSTSQRSYDQLTEHYSRLVSLIQQEGGYVPNEPEIAKFALQERLTQLRNHNTEVVIAEQKLVTARQKRDDILYHPVTGLVQLATEVKKYVKSAFGTTDGRYDRIRAMEFTRV